MARQRSEAAVQGESRVDDEAGRWSGGRAAQRSGGVAGGMAGCRGVSGSYGGTARTCARLYRQGKAIRCVLLL